MPITLDGSALTIENLVAIARNGEKVAWFTRREDGTSCEGQVAKAEKEYLKDAKVRLYASTDHVADFLARVKDRKKPITNETVGGRSANGRRHEAARIPGLCPSSRKPRRHEPARSPPRLPPVRLAAGLCRGSLG